MSLFNDEPTVHEEPGFGANFRAMFTPYRHMTWLMGGFTVEQFLIFGFWALLPPLVLSFLAVLTTSWLYFLALPSVMVGAFIGFRTAHRLDDPRRYGHTHMQYLWDRIRARRRPRHMAGGRAFYPGLRKGKSILWASTTKEVEP